MKEIAIHRGPVPAEKLIVKDNELIMASYQLSVEEQRLVLACMEKVQRLDKRKTPAGAIEVTLNAKEYAELYNVKMNAAYKGLREGSDRLYDRSITMDTKDATGTRRYRWLQETAIYDSGKVTLVFSEVVSRHITYIVSGVTAYRLTQATQLKSKHAIRLFEIFQTVIDHDSGEGIWVVSLDDLRNTLELGASYDRWIDLKKQVIIAPLRQINKNTSLKVDWEIASKEGKKVESIQFTVFESNQLTLSL